MKSAQAIIALTEGEVFHAQVEDIIAARVQAAEKALRAEIGLALGWLEGDKAAPPNG